MLKSEHLDKPSVNDKVEWDELSDQNVGKGLD